MRLRLRAVALGDFRKAGATLLAEWQAAHKQTLTSSDCVAFLSGTRTQVQFVRPPMEVKNPRYQPGRGKDRYRCVESIKLRLDGTWNPLMLQNYAESVGLDIGLRRFESYLNAAIRGEDA